MPRPLGDATGERHVQPSGGGWVRVATAEQTRHPVTNAVVSIGNGSRHDGVGRQRRQLRYIHANLIAKA
jgi:hypothetical protein